MGPVLLGVKGFDIHHERQLRAGAFCSTPSVRDGCPSVLSEPIRTFKGMNSADASCYCRLQQWNSSIMSRENCGFAVNNTAVRGRDNGVERQ